MIIKIALMVIGLLIFAAGLFYLKEEKDDPESKKLYTGFSIIGVIVFAIGLIWYLF